DIILEVMSGDLGYHGPLGSQSGTLVLDTSSGRLGGNLIGYVGGDVQINMTGVTFGDRSGNITFTTGGSLRGGNGGGFLTGGGSFGGNVILYSPNGSIEVDGGSSGGFLLGNGDSINTSGNLSSGHFKAMSGFSQSYIYGINTSTSGFAGDVALGM